MNKHPSPPRIINTCPPARRYNCMLMLLAPAGALKRAVIKCGWMAKTRGRRSKGRRNGGDVLMIDEGKAGRNATQSRLVHRRRTSEPNKTRDSGGRASETRSARERRRITRDRLFIDRATTGGVLKVLNLVLMCFGGGFDHKTLMIDAQNALEWFLFLL